MIKRALCIFGFVAMALLGISAYGNAADGASFLNIGVGAAGQSMGGAYMARVADPSAMYWNPSGLAQIQSKEIFLYRSQLFADFNYNYIAYAQPFPHYRAAFGFAAGYYSKGSQQGMDENRRMTGDFSADDKWFVFTFSRKFGNKASLGTSVNYMRSQIGSYSSNGVAVDFSGSYQLSANTRLAAGFFHMGPSMKYISQSYELPSNFTAGLSQKLLGSLTLTADSRYELHTRKINLALGGEMEVARMASLRMGYISQAAQSSGKMGAASEINQIAGLGMGIGIKVMNHANFNYAFIPMGELGGTHHVDLTWRFK